MSHQDKASRVSIFPLSGRACWKVFRLHFHYVPFISGASVFPARRGRVAWGQGRSVTLWPEAPEGGGPLPPHLSAARGTPCDHVAVSTAIVPGAAALRGRDGPAFACETCGLRRGEKGHHHRSVSGLLPVLSSSRGGEGRKRERMRPPESLRLGGRSQPLAGRRCPALWPRRPLSDQLSSQRSACLFQSDSQKAGSLRRSHCPGGGVHGVLPGTSTPPPTASVPVVNSVQRSGLHHASHWPQRQGTRGRPSAKWEHGFTRPGWA